jgi:hypothetical protein
MAKSHAYAGDQQQKVAAGKYGRRKKQGKATMSFVRLPRSATIPRGIAENMATIAYMKETMNAVPESDRLNSLLIGSVTMDMNAT